MFIGLKDSRLDRKFNDVVDCIGVYLVEGPFLFIKFEVEEYLVS